MACEELAIAVVGTVDPDDDHMKDCLNEAIRTILAQWTFHYAPLLMVRTEDEALAAVVCAVAKDRGYRTSSIDSTNTIRPVRHSFDESLVGVCDRFATNDHFVERAVAVVCFGTDPADQELCSIFRGQLKAAFQYYL